MIVGVWWCSKLLLGAVQADPQTDEVFAQMDLTPQYEVLPAVQ